uniref:Secreted protein n=1 Tax=Canis lupus familiaris TaxID=9615 RepID=A0A8C0RQL5_CANLF
MLWTLSLDFLHTTGVLLAYEPQDQGAAAVGGFPLWSLSLCMFKGKLLSLSLSLFFFFFFFFFFFLLFSSSWGVDAAKMRGYRSARVPEVCIEFRSRII